MPVDDRNQTTMAQNAMGQGKQKGTNLSLSENWEEDISDGTPRSPRSDE